MRLPSRLIVAACATFLLPAALRASVVEQSMSFKVTLQNRTLVPCLGAGSGSMDIAGTLIEPAERPTPTSVTLYLHGLGFGQWFWHLTEFSDLDYATLLAEQGHASVIIDRLGYGASPLADGNQSCVGVQADIADQIAKQLRDQGFTKVALAGHSAGGATAQVAAYSFPGDFDALIVMSYADQGASPDALLAFAQAGGQCLTGSNHYASFGPGDADFAHLMFNEPRALTGQLPIIDSGPTGRPEVVAAATAMREPDPCGDDMSLPFEIVLSQVLLSQVHVPTLLVCGDRDALFPPPACDLQALHFLSSADFTHTTIAGAGHAVTLGNTAARFRAAVASWLADRGF